MQVNGGHGGPGARPYSPFSKDWSFREGWAWSGAEFAIYVTGKSPFVLLLFFFFNLRIADTAQMKNPPTRVSYLQQHS